MRSKNIEIKIVSSKTINKLFHAIVEKNNKMIGLEITIEMDKLFIQQFNNLY
jgi:hypothetical protein